MYETWDAGRLFVRGTIHLQKVNTLSLKDMWCQMKMKIKNMSN